MSDHFISPYVIYFEQRTTQKRKPPNYYLGKIPFKVKDSNGSDSVKADCSAIDQIEQAIANLRARGPYTIKPKKDSTDGKPSPKSIKFGAITKKDESLFLKVKVGITDIESTITKTETGEEIPRKREDKEEVDLRVYMYLNPSERVGVIIFEKFWPYSSAHLFREALKHEMRDLGCAPGTHIDPVKNADSIKKMIDDLEVTSLEFRSIEATKDAASDAREGGKSVDFKKSIKITQKGGLGKFARIRGRKTSEIRSQYGIGDGDSEATRDSPLATVKFPNGQERKISIDDQKTGSVSFMLNPSSGFTTPSDDDFVRGCVSAINDIRPHIGLGHCPSHP